MVYTLDKADQRCDVTYVDWSKKYSPIPKATCEMIQPKCSSGGGGGSSDDALELSCEEIKKLLKGEDKPKEDKPKEDTPTEDKPQENPKEEETPNEDGKEVNLLELMPRVEDKFSTVLFNEGTVLSVTDNSPDEKVAFENEIITTLKRKLPDGAVVEAVLGEPYYKEGSEIVNDKTNYTIHVRVTLKGKVYEQEYNVPNEAFAVPIDSI